MEISRFVGLVSSLVMLLGMIPYLRGIFKGAVHPHLFSWLVWGILTAVGAAAQISKGAGPGAWITMTNCAFCLLVAALSLRLGEKNITRSDWVFFTASLCAIPLWIATSDPFWSVILITVIDGVAFIPTWRKSWDRPWSEGMAPYICCVIGFALGIAAMKDVNVVTAFYPAVLVFLNAAFVMLVFIRRRRISMA